MSGRTEGARSRPPDAANPAQTPGRIPHARHSSTATPAPLRTAALLTPPRNSARCKASRVQVSGRCGGHARIALRTLADGARESDCQGALKGALKHQLLSESVPESPFRFPMEAQGSIISVQSLVESGPTFVDAKRSLVDLLAHAGLNSAEPRPSLVELGPNSWTNLVDPKPNSFEFRTDLHAKRAAPFSAPSGCRPLPIAPASTHACRLPPAAAALDKCFGWAPNPLAPHTEGARKCAAQPKHPRRGWHEVLSKMGYGDQQPNTSSMSLSMNDRSAVHAVVQKSVRSYSPSAPGSNSARSRSNSETDHVRPNSAKAPIPDEIDQKMAEIVSNSFEFGQVRSKSGQVRLNYLEIAPKLVEIAH